MSRITVGKYVPRDFHKLTRLELYDVWFRQSLSDKTVALLYGVTVSDVKKKRKKFGLNFRTCISLAFKGGEQFSLMAPAKIKIK